MSLTSSVEYFQNFDPKKLIKASTKEVNLETCINVVGMAKDIAPYQSGQLKNSIGYAVPGGQPPRLLDRVMEAEDITV